MTNKNLTSDLPDSEKDKVKLQPEETVLDLPDVKDIPGQENIHVPELREMADTTISSDDEEGVGIFDEDDEDLEAELDEQDDDNDTEAGELDVTDDPVDEDSDVTEDEKEVLDRAGNMDTEDDANLYLEKLDDTDFDGEKLNENEDFSGDDLDVPGDEEDDEDEKIGEEDEENNPYSLGDNK